MTLQEKIGQLLIVGFDGYEIKNEDILTFEVGSKNKSFTGRYNVTQKQIQESLEQTNNAIEKIALLDDLNFNLHNLNTTYKESLKRYRESQKARIILWEFPKDIWNHIKVSSVGDINEAYAGIVLLNKDLPSFMLSLEENIGDFAEKIAEVSNESGMLSGDVVDGQIQYGIK